MNISELDESEETKHYTDQEVIEALVNCFNKIASSQQRLPPDMEKIIHDNLWDLYEES